MISRHTQWIQRLYRIDQPGEGIRSAKMSTYCRIHLSYGATDIAIPAIEFLDAVSEAT